MNNILLHNQEHREAMQQAIFQKNENFIETLDDDQKRKFQAVEDAIKILSDNNVRCYLFPALPSPIAKNKDSVWQYNNHDHFIEYEGGKSSRNSLIKTAIFNTTFYAAFYSWLCTTQNINPYNVLPSVMGKAIFDTYEKGMNWLRNDVPPYDEDELK